MCLCRWWGAAEDRHCWQPVTELLCGVSSDDCARGGLATFTHHAAPRGQNKARSGREERVARHGHDPEEPLSQPELFVVFDEEPDGVRPSPLSEVAGWHDRVERHTGEHIVEICPYVPVLDVLVPQMGGQLVNFFGFLDVQSPVEQVIDVPKISEDSIQQQLLDRDSRVPQMAEQLVGVPTVLTLAVLAEQIVDIPVPGRGGGGGQGGFPGFPPRQSSAASGAEQIVDFLVGGGLQGFLPRQGSRTANEITDNLAGGGLHGFLPNPGASSSSTVSREESGHGVLRTFPQVKKSAEVARQVDETMPGHVSSSTPAACVVHHVVTEGADHDQRRPVLLAPTAAEGVIQMPPGTRPGLVTSRWPLRACRNWPSSAVAVGLVLICTLVEWLT